MEEIENTIRRFGQRRDAKSLEEYIELIETDQFIQLIKDKYSNPMFNSFFTYLMEGFTNTYEAHEKRYKIIVELLKCLQNDVVTSDKSKEEIIHKISVQMEKFKVNHLVQLCIFCKNSIQRGLSKDLSWRVFLPTLISTLIRAEILEYCGEEMTGEEFKAKLIEGLLMMEWSPEIVTTLAGTFEKLNLSKDEHANTVNKLVPFVNKLTPQELPAFIYQMLKFCIRQNCSAIFLQLINYFGHHIYSNEVIQDSDSLESIETTAQIDIIQAESTILLHINDAASFCFDLKEYLNALKNLIKSPEFILHPFQLTVLLSLSNNQDVEDRISEIIKPSIYRMILEDQKKNESVWFKDMVPKIKNLENTLTRIINSSIERNMVITGLINLSFNLLSSGLALGRESATIKMWELANLILLQIIKHHDHTTDVILNKVVNYINIGSNVQQYINFLNILIRTSVLTVLHNQSCIVQLMEQLINKPASTARMILNAMLPLLRISNTLRDHIILLLRKALFSRTLENRETAVYGYVRLLKLLRITNPVALSQSSSSSSSSSHSILTHISLTSSSQFTSSVFTKEALCLEILNILSRCLMQNVDVKMILYEGLSSVVKKNVELSIPILERLQRYFMVYYEDDDEILPPLKFSKIVQLKNAEAILLEPLGKLIFNFGLILLESKECSERSQTCVKFDKIFVTLSEKMAQSDLEHFELNDGTDLMDIIPEVQQKALVLKEALSVYEALIGYNIYAWNNESEHNGKVIEHLFKGYNRLIQFSKTSVKSKKGEKKKKDDLTVSSSSSSKSGTSSKAFKLPDTVLNLEVLQKALELLHYSSVNWTTNDKTNAIKINIEFHKYIMLSTINVLQSIKHLKNLDEEEKHYNFAYCTKIATIVYTRCVVRFEEFVKFDSSVAVLAVECFYAALQLINTHFQNKWAEFLSVIGGKEVSANISVHLGPFLEVYKDLFDTIDDSVQDTESIKFFQTVINSLMILGTKLPSESNVTANELLDWMINFVHDRKISGKITLNTFITFLLKLQVKYKSSITIFKNFAINLKKIMGSISDEEENEEVIREIEIITEETAPTIFMCLCSELKVLLDDIDWIILRLRSDYGLITFPGQEGIETKREYLKSKEKSICCQICQIISIMIHVSHTCLPLGPNSETALKLMTHLFTTLNNLTKHFVTRSTKLNLAFQEACFEGVVKLAGRKLSANIYKFILYIDQSQKETESPKKKRNAATQKTRVLRETRLIPKLIYEIEQFSKVISQLSKKTNVDLTRYVGQGTTRDFRILNIQEALGDNQEGAENEEADATIDSLSTNDVSSVQDESGESSMQIRSQETDDEEPSKKKSKRK